MRGARTKNEVSAGLLQSWKTNQEMAKKRLLHCCWLFLDIGNAANKRKISVSHSLAFSSGSRYYSQPIAKIDKKSFQSRVTSSH